MRKLVSTAFLVLLGILLSVKAFSKEIILTEDNHIIFSGPVNDTSVTQAQINLAKLSIKLNSNDVIYLVIDSPGGSVPAGNLFIDFANSLPQKIKPICIFCASMGYHMFQSFDQRLVYSSSTLMSHRVRIGGLDGQVPGEATERLAGILRVSNAMDTKVAKRVGTSREAYQKLIYDELWLDGDSAVQMNHADKVAKIRCSDALINGVRTEIIETFFGPLQATFSKCPLISGVVSVKAEANSKFKSEAEAMETIKKVKRNVTWSF